MKARTKAMRLGSWWIVALVVMLIPALALGAERQRRLKAGEYNPAHATVEMFKAINDGDIEVRLIPKDSTESRVIIKNKTDQPLNVKLPEAFAGVPVLAQIGGGIGGMGGGGGLGGRGGRNGGNSGGNQSMGGGMGGMMGGMMNVPAEDVGNFEVPTVCLEHGKKEPRPQIPYEIKPIEQFNDKAEIRQLCRMLGTGQLNQRAAQASAWHFSDGMSWQALAAKRLRHANGTSEPYFQPAEIKAAMQIAATAERMAEEQRREQPSEKSEKSDSLSRE